MPWFGKRDLRDRVESGTAKQAEMGWRMKTLEVVAMVKQAYYDLWQTQRELEVNEHNQELMRQFVEVARVRYETGKASQSDLIRAQNELATGSSILWQVTHSCNCGRYPASFSRCSSK